MHKLKFSSILPITQGVVSAILLHWANQSNIPGYVPTARLVCWGLSAPALLFRGVGLLLTRLQSVFPRVIESVFGLYTDDLFFLLGVIVVWHLAGCTLDHRRASRAVVARRTATTVIVNALLLTLGGILFALGWRDMVRPPYNNPAFPIGAVLTWLWAFSLISINGKRLLTAIRDAIRHSD
jgi:hypothetical protein